MNALQFSQCQDAQTPNSSFKTAKIHNAYIQNAQFQNAQFQNTQFCCIATSSYNMRNKKYCKIAEQFNMATAFFILLFPSA
jgi:uncharacterized protein YjbI with pentapeptide repeats